MKMFIVQDTWASRTWFVLAFNKREAGEKVLKSGVDEDLTFDDLGIDECKEIVEVSTKISFDIY